MVCLPHPLVQVRLATQRFGRISNHPGKCFEGTEFCFVRNRPAIRCLRTLANDGLRHKGCSLLSAALKSGNHPYIVKEAA